MRFPHFIPGAFPRPLFPGAIVLIILAISNPAAHAGESGTADLSPFQLRIEREAFQLAARRMDTPVTEAPQESALPPQLASHRFADLIDKAAHSVSLDPVLVHSIIAVESAHNPAARSVKGAVGLMQVMPATASRYGVADAASSPEANLRAGTRYLRFLMDLFDNQLELVLAAYNAGEHAVLRYGRRIPPFRETRQYVPAVLARYEAWRRPMPAVMPATAAPDRIHYMPGTRLAPRVHDAASHP